MYTLIFEGSPVLDVLVVDLSKMSTLFLTTIKSKFEFGEVAGLQCLRLFSHTYSRNWSWTCLIHFKFLSNGVVYNVYIAFQRFTSLTGIRLQLLCCILNTYSQHLSLVKLLVYNVYVRFRSYIIEIELAWFTLNFVEMVLPTMSLLISKGSPVSHVLVLDLSTMSALFLTHI